MENVNKIIRIAGSAIIFCIGLYVLIFESEAYSAALKLTRERIKEDVLYPQQLSASNRETTSYAEIMAALMQPLDYDIIIDSLPVYKDEHNRFMIINYDIPRNNYLKSYSYNANGDITAVVYTSIP